MCKKQTAVSHSSTEAVIISLDAGFRKAGLLDPSLSLTSSRFPAGRATFSRDILQSEELIHGCVTLPYSERTVHSVDRVPQNVGPSNNRVDVLVFEDSRAAIKMIIQGRSPHLRHVLMWIFYFDVNLHRNVDGEQSRRVKRRNMPIDPRPSVMEEGHQQSHFYSGQEGSELDPLESVFVVQLRAKLFFCLQGNIEASLTREAGRIASSGKPRTQQHDCFFLPCTSTGKGLSDKTWTKTSSDHDALPRCTRSPTQNDESVARPCRLPTRSPDERTCSQRLGTTGEDNEFFWHVLRG